MLTTTQIKLCLTLATAGVVPSQWPRDHTEAQCLCAGTWSALGVHDLTFGEVLRPGGYVNKEAFTTWLDTRAHAAPVAPAADSDAYQHHVRHTVLLSSLTGFLVKHGIGSPGECAVEVVKRELAKAYDIDMRTDDEKLVDKAADVLSEANRGFLPTTSHKLAVTLHAAGLLKDPTT